MWQRSHKTGGNYRSVLKIYKNQPVNVAGRIINIRKTWSNFVYCPLKDNSSKTPAFFYEKDKNIRGPDHGR
jgi:exonuclease VII large subunit